jgi:hypothetical protein
MESESEQQQDIESPLILWASRVLDTVINLVLLFVSSVYSLRFRLTILRDTLSGEYSKLEAENDDDDAYEPDAVYVGQTDDLSVVSGGCADRTTLIISRIIETDGTNYLTIDSPRPMDSLYAKTLLAMSLEYLDSDECIFSTIGGTWMTDAEVAEKPYRDGGEDDVRIQ